MSSRYKPYLACFLCELIGTFLLVVIGDGTSAAYVLTNREVDTFAVCFAFGVGAMMASFVGGRISGAHINPAMSVVRSLDGQLKWSLLPVYLAAQYLGGFLAALMLLVNYGEAINSLDGGDHSAFGSSNSTGSIFATYPAHWVTAWGCLLDQILGTSVLIFSLSAVSDRRNVNLCAGVQPFAGALIIGFTCMAFNPNCGAIFNPARDLAPRILSAVAGYPSVWAPLEGLYWLLAGVLGPHIGAILGHFGYKYLIGNSLPPEHTGASACPSASHLDHNESHIQHRYPHPHPHPHFGSHSHPHPHLYQSHNEPRPAQRPARRPKFTQDQQQKAEKLPVNLQTLTNSITYPSLLFAEQKQQQQQQHHQVGSGKPACSKTPISVINLEQHLQ